jgi:hypothetical protein
MWRVDLERSHSQSVHKMPTRYEGGHRKATREVVSERAVREFSMSRVSSIHMVVPCL